MNSYNLAELAQALFEEAGDALFLFEPETEQILDVNPLAQRLSNFTRKELLTMEVSYLFHSDARGAMLRLRRAFKETQFFHSQEDFVLRHRQAGLWIPVNLTVVRLHVQPRTLGLITARDIREQREAYAQVRKAETWLRTVVSNSPGILYAMDPSGVFTLCEGKGLNELGLEPTALVGQSALELYRDAPQALKVVQRILKGEAFADVIEVESGPGAGHCFEVHSTPLRDTEGRLIGALGIVSNMTERRRAEEAMERQSATLREQASLLDLAHDAIIVLDLDDAIRFWNHGAEEMFGWAREEALGRNAFHLLRSQLPRPLEEIRTECLREGRWEGEAIHSRRDASQVVVSTRWAVRRDDQGRPTAILMISNDITPRKQAEAALREKEARLRRLEESDLIGIILVDLRGGILAANDTFLRCVGYTRADLHAGRVRWDRMTPLEYRPQDERAIEQLRATGVAAPWEKEYIRKDGSQVPVLVGVAMLEGSADECVSFVLDLSERKQAERALRDSEALYHSLVETLPLCVFRKDLEGRFTFGNARFLETLGLLLGELVGKTDHDFYPEALADKYRQDDLRVIASRRIWEDVEEHQQPDGNHLYVQVLKSPIYDARSQVVGIQGLFWDVTARKTAEERLRRTAAELARSNAELEQFAYVASHDLQEPLRMVASYCQLLKRRYQGQLDPDAHEFIDFAVDGASRMQKLINDLLAYSRTGTRGKPLVETDTGVILERVLANLKMPLEENQVTVTADPLPVVIADPTQLTQLLQNLISNATKFRCPSRPAAIHVSAEQREQEWLFAVRDNGIGIAPEHCDRIFLIFQRLHSRDEYPGTGIGLAVCKRIVERHGGRIWVKSEPGRGSTFFFTLPRKPIPSNGTPPEHAHEPSPLGTAEGKIEA